MEHKLRKFSTHELLPVAHELIQSGKKVIISVSGNSMRPFIVGDRDKVLLGKARALKKEMLSYSGISRGIIFCIEFTASKKASAKPLEITV